MKSLSNTDIASRLAEIADLYRARAARSGRVLVPPGEDLDEA